MFEIYNNRKQLWQWSTDQRLIVKNEYCGEVHFSNIENESPIVRYVYDEDGCRFVDVPNELLKTSKTLKVYAYNWGGDMLGRQVFIVYPRPVPENYIDPPERTAGMATFALRPESEGHIVVNEDRTISVPEELRCIAVEYDHNIETVTFDCPRFWDGHDFSEMNVYINYRCADGKVGQCFCDSVTIDESDDKIIHFDWTISRNLTCAKGKIAFLVCIKSLDDSGGLSKHWSSRLNQEMEVMEGIECVGEPVDVEPPVLEEILTRLDLLEQSTNTGGSGGGVAFRPGNALELKGGTLNVLTTDEAEEDNTLPITSAGVHTIVGNIGAILDTI